MELQDDLRPLEAAKQRLAIRDDEIIPFSIITRRLSDENAVKIWREHRQITQEQLVLASGVSRTMLGSIEAGHKHGSTTTLKKLAAALKCEIGNLA